MLLVRAVVFDLDDTLLPESDYIASGYAHVARWLAPRIGVPVDTLIEQLWQIFNSPFRAQAYNRLLDIHGIRDANLVTACVREYREHVPNISLSPSVRGLIDWFRTQGPVGIVTDGPAAMQATKVSALGLYESGVEVVLTDALGGKDAWKPSPVGLQEVCDRMGVEPRDAIYVGDNPAKDFLAAHAAGMAAIRYRFPGQLHAQLEHGEGAGPDLEIQDLAELRTLLRFRGSGSPKS